MLIPAMMLLALAAQDRDLPAPMGSVKELRTITSVAEVGADRLVIAQPDEQHVLLVDLSTGTKTQIGRQGEGPGEFVVPMDVFALDSGRFAVLDTRLDRVSRFDQRGRFLSSEPRPAALGHDWLAISSSGARFGLMTATEGPTTEPHPTGRLVRYVPKGDSTLDLATVALTPWVHVAPGRGTVARINYAAHDEAGVLPDGTVWIARQDGPRIEWRSSDGAWRSSEALEIHRVATTAGDRMTVEDLPSRGGGMIDLPMAEVKGPFENAVAAPDGEVWLRLYGQAGDKFVTYLAVPPSGVPRRFRVEVSKRVLAVGETSVYLGHEDVDGFTVLEWIRRP